MAMASPMAGPMGFRIEERHRPATVGETAVGVFLGSTRSLGNTVQAHEVTDNQNALLSSFAALAIRLHPAGSRTGPESSCRRRGGGRRSAARRWNYPLSNASAIRTSRSFLTSASGRGSSTGKCSDPLVEV